MKLHSEISCKLSVLFILSSMHKSAFNSVPMAPVSTACAKLKVGHFVGNNMYKTPPKFHKAMRGGAPDLCSPLKILLTDWRLIIPSGVTPADLQAHKRSSSTMKL
jgi:hypothetical protein